MRNPISVIAWRHP